MTLPTMTWRVSAEYPITGSATTTTTELLTAIKAAFDAEDAIGNNYWIADYFTTASNHNMLTFRRKGTPAGTLGTFRVCLFGGTAPNAAAVIACSTATASSVYACCAEDAGTTTPADYTTGAVWSTTKACPGSACIPAAGLPLAANTPTVLIVENEEQCTIFVRDTAGQSWVTFGACAEEYSNPGVRVWGTFSSIGRYLASVVVVNVTTASTAEPFPTMSSAGTGNNAPGVCYTSGVRLVYRTGLAAMHTNANPYSNSAVTLLHPIILNNRLNNTSTNYGELFGKLRQFAVGPILTGKRALYDGGSNLIGYAINGGSTVSGHSVVLTNSP